MSVDAGIIVKIFIWLCGIVSKNYANFRLYVQCMMPPRGREVRFVYSCLLNIIIGGRYLLIRNAHRPETVAPIGGVVKYRAVAKILLDEMDYRPHLVDESSEDNDRDVRGFVQKKYLLNLKKLCNDERYVESIQECIRREIKEELCEIGIRPPAVIDRCTFRKVRLVTEPLIPVEGQPHLSHRVFCVVELIDDAPAKKFREFIKSKIKIPGLSLCSEDEIHRRRDEYSAIISSTTEYLFSSIPRKESIYSVPFICKRH